MIYTHLTQIPEEHQALIRRLVIKGVLSINQKGEFRISEDLLEVLLVLSRLDLIP